MFGKRIVVCMVVFFMVICTSGLTWAAGPVKGGTLKIGLSTDPPDLNPFVQSGGSAERVKSMVYDSLLVYDMEGNLQPCLAESWQNPEPTTYVFKIRENAKFQNGQPVTAEDVKFSMDMILKPETGAFLQKNLEGLIDKITVVDPRTVRFDLKEPNATFLGLLGMSHAAIVSKKWVEEGHNLKNEMMGAGPFQFVKWDLGVRLTLTRNRYFWKEGLPYLDGIELIPIKDEDVRVNALMAGEVDFIDFPPWKSWNAIEAKDNLTIDKSANFAMVLFFNPKYKPFSDPRVRRAVTMAIDDKIIADVVFFGHAVSTGGGLLPPGHWATSPEIQEKLLFNPEKAKQLLAEAGYKDGFKAKLLATSTYGMHRMTAEVIQDVLKNVGIQVELELEEWGTTVERRGKGDYQFMVYAAGLTRPDPDFYAGYIESDAGFMARPVGYKDEMTDDLLELGRLTLNPELRKKVYHILELRFLEESPIGVLARRQTGFAFDKKVHGFKNFSLGYMSCVSAFEGVWLSK